MLTKLWTVFNTVKHLQFEQIKYQLWYRIKTRFIRLTRYTKYQSAVLYPIPSSSYHVLIPSTGKYLGNHTFSFLNIQHEFPSSIDWNCMIHGKLWNYNLQYFDFLHDPAIPSSEKEFLINDFAEALLNGTIKPEPYPVSLRLVNWILYHTETGYEAEIFKKVLQLQVGYLQNNLEFHIKANHLFENYTALLFCGLALRDQSLLKQAWGGLQQQVKEQVLADGGHYECSPMYHSILLAKLILIISALKNTDVNFNDQTIIKGKAAEMMAWLEAFCFKDNSWALMNDATGGIAPSLQEIRSAAEQIDLEVVTKKLKESGYRKINGEGFEIMIDAGNIIPSFQPGHAHSDMLSFCLQHANRPILVDTGVGTYQSNGQRKIERGTPAHNTVTLAEQDQSEVWGSFRVGARASMTIHKDEPNFLEASHDGYKKRFGATHKRSFSVDEKKITIVDSIMGNQSNATGTACFHFDTSTKLVVNDSAATITVNHSCLISFAGHVTITSENYQQAVAFNTYRQAICIKVTFTELLTTSISFQ